MALEFNDWIESGKKYATGYASWFYCTLATPWKTSPSMISQGTADSEQSASLSTGQNLVILIAISIFLGVTIGAIIPNRPKLQDRTTVLVVVCGIWIFVGWLIHSICRLLGGKGTFAESMIAILQVLAAVYTASNLITFISVNTYRTFLKGSNIDSVLISNPGSVLVILQCLLLLYYIPASLTPIHKFTRSALAIVAIVSAICAFVIFLPVALAGGCAAPY
jgi:hypothetical protein